MDFAGKLLQHVVVRKMLHVAKMYTARPRKCKKLNFVLSFGVWRWTSLQHLCSVFRTTRFCNNLPPTSKQHVFSAFYNSKRKSWFSIVGAFAQHAASDAARFQLRRSCTRRAEHRARACMRCTPCTQLRGDCRTLAKEPEAGPTFNFLSFGSVLASGVLVVSQSARTSRSEGSDFAPGPNK